MINTPNLTTIPIIYMYNLTYSLYTLSWARAHFSITRTYDLITWAEALFCSSVGNVMGLFQSAMPTSGPILPPFHTTSLLYTISKISSSHLLLFHLQFPLPSHIKCIDFLEKLCEWGGGGGALKFNF